MRRATVLTLVFVAFAAVPADAPAASWWWWRKADATLSVTQSVTWTTASTRPCELNGQGTWVFDARPREPIPTQIEFLGGGYVTKGEGGYRFFDRGRRHFTILPAAGTATAEVVQNPSGDPEVPCDGVPDLSQCGTRAFPRRYDGVFLLGRPRIGRLTGHIEGIPDPDDLPGSGEIPCLRIDPRLPGAGYQLDLVGTDIPVRRVFRRRSVTFRGSRSFQNRPYSIVAGGVDAEVRLSMNLTWELRLRARERTHQQCSYETRRNRCPRL